VVFHGDGNATLVQPASNHAGPRACCCTFAHPRHGYVVHVVFHGDGNATLVQSA